MKDKVTVIGIAGGTGSGKTTVVKKLVESAAASLCGCGAPRFIL